MDSITLAAIATAIVVGIAIVFFAIRQTEKKTRRVLQEMREVPLGEVIQRFASSLEKQLGLPIQGIEDLDEFIVSVPPVKKDDIAFVLGVAGLIPKCMGLTGSWRSPPNSDGAVLFVTASRELPLSDWIRARIGRDSAPSLQSLISTSLEERA